MKRLSVVLLILVFGFMMFAPSFFVAVSSGVGFAQEEEGEGEESDLEEDEGSVTVNINTASAEELAALDGIGERLAQNIVEYREANGLFATIEDVKSVKGIGDKKLEKIKEFITVE
jgi:competence protein ComEA